MRKVPEIERGIPIPNLVSMKGTWVHIISRMLPGDSIQVEQAEIASVLSSARAFSKKHQGGAWKFKARRVSDENGKPTDKHRLWRTE